MAVDSTTLSRWDILHRDLRHQLAYPSEHVVRWVAGLPSRGGDAVDIGCGAGRHTELLDDYGFKTVGTDLSVNAPLARVHANMTGLPFEANTFEAAVAFGVFYYGSPGDADDAIAEMWRVLKPGGHGFVSYRTCRDWRAKHTDVEGVFGLPGHPEDGMQMDFVTEAELLEMFDAFGEVEYELSEWSTDAMERLNSDWLVSVKK